MGDILADTRSLSHGSNDVGLRGHNLGLGYGGFPQKRALIGLQTDKGRLGKSMLKDFRKTAFRSSHIHSFLYLKAKKLMVLGYR